MIRKKTTFVVGAGASMELDFPSGADLVNKIARNLCFEKDAFGRIQRLTSDQKIFDQALRLHCRSYSLDFDAFRFKGLELSNGVKNSVSIDNFVHSHAENNYFSSIAKIAIAQIILKAENAIFNSDELYGKPLTELNYKTEYWLTKFCSLHFKNTQRHNLKNLFDNVKFVSFNYDRCILHFVAVLVAQYYLLDDSTARELAQSLEIIHPYGSLGSTKSKSQVVLPFGAEPNPANICQASQGINTFTEGPSSPEFATQMDNLMNWSEQIVFLGFGFDEINLKLLQASSNQNSPKSVIGTAYKMPEPNIGYLNYILPQQFNASLRYTPLRVDLTAHKLLEEYSMILFS